MYLSSSMGSWTWAENVYEVTRNENENEKQKAKPNEMDALAV